MRGAGEGGGSGVGGKGREGETRIRGGGRVDVVFGPARDGGYWLVGMKRRPRFTDPFRGVRWSTELALADTVANLEPGQTHTLLETLEDIDEGEAYRRFIQTRTPPSTARRP